MTLPACTCRFRKPSGVLFCDKAAEQLTAASRAKNEMHFMETSLAATHKTKPLAPSEFLQSCASAPGSGALDQLVDIGMRCRRRQRATRAKDVVTARRQHFERLAAGRFHAFEAAFMQNP